MIFLTTVRTIDQRYELDASATSRSFHMVGNFIGSCIAKAQPGDAFDVTIEVIDEDSPRKCLDVECRREDPHWPCEDCPQ